MLTSKAPTIIYDTQTVMVNKSFFSENLTLKNLTIPRFMAAPMDGVIDSPMRRMIRKFSSKELLFTEMFHASTVAFDKRERPVKYDPIEQPLAFQISGSDTRFIDRAVDKILKHKFIMLNLNAGCPAKNVIKSGCGSALMSKPEKLKELLLALYKRVENKIPLTIKIRAGFKEKNALEIAQLAQDCGVEMLMIHPRTQPGGLSARLDFDLVKSIKQKLSIPVIFSGNIFNFETAQKTYAKTGVDGFMIGRALWGCPWKLREIEAEILGEEFSVSIEEAIKLALTHLEYNIEFYGEPGVHAFKKQLPQYIKGLPNAATLRSELLRSQNSVEMKNRLSALYS
jgi:nifR3 family TIM-barrel protein